jgi:hypothetical protein
LLSTKIILKRGLPTEVYQTIKILSNYEFRDFINFAENGIIALKIILPGGYQKNYGLGKRNNGNCGDIA